MKISRGSMIFFWRWMQTYNTLRNYVWTSWFTILDRPLITISSWSTEFMKESKTNSNRRKKMSNIQMSSAYNHRRMATISCSIRIMPIQIENDFRLFLVIRSRHQVKKRSKSCSPNNFKAFLMKFKK